jgi:hypothetical protein
MAGKKRRYSCGLANLIIHSKLGIREEPGPVILGVVNISVEVVLQALYSIFGLAISLG